MHITQAFGTTTDGKLWLEYTAHIEGRQVSSRVQVDFSHAPCPQCPQYVIEDLRRQIMRRIEDKLFENVP